MCLRATLACMLVWFAVACPAQAAESEAAAAAYKLALHHYEAEAFDKAAPLFHQAFAIRPEPVFLYNAARAEERGGHTETAVNTYRKLLALSDIPEKMADKAREHLATAEAEVAKRRAARERAQAEQAAALAREQEAARLRAAEEAASTRKMIGWASAGTGLVLLGGAAWLLASWSSDQAALDEKVADRVDGMVVKTSFEAYTAEQDRVDRLGVMGASAAGLGAAALGLGAWMLLSTDEPTAVAVMPEPRGARLVVRF